MNLSSITEGYINLIKSGIGIADINIEKLATKRKMLCSICPNNSTQKIVSLISHCKICGCLLEAKTRVVEEKCPDNKW